MAYLYANYNIILLINILKYYMQIASIAILTFGDITNQSKSYLYTSTVQ